MLNTSHQTSTIFLTAALDHCVLPNLSAQTTQRKDTLLLLRDRVNLLMMQLDTSSAPYRSEA